MLYYLNIPSEITKLFPYFGTAIAFVLTVIFTSCLKGMLPTDRGKTLAVGGEKSAGKPCGAGIIFVSVFALVAFIFVPLSLEHIIYILLIYVCMMAGFMDDRSNTPWKRGVKALFDLLVAGAAVATYITNNQDLVSGGFIHIQLLYNDAGFNLPIVVFAILAVLLIFISINVTNCTDGVDGLSGCISIVSMLTIYGIMMVKRDVIGLNPHSCSGMLLMFIGALAAYLWFNAPPSKVLMGDAGSRAIGFFIALMCIKTGSPFLYIPVAIVFIIDGGIGLVKIILIRVFHVKNAMKNLRTPLHDHMRKNKGWSDTQTVLRFAIIQVVVSIVLILASYI